MHAAPASASGGGRAHTVDIPPLGGAPAGAPSAAALPESAVRVLLGFAPRRTSQWSVWSMLTGLAQVGRVRTHQLVSV